ncbi:MULTISPECIES: PQQ-binding-like beta-propeller repeat protein [Haloarcula]|uniref:PQQ-binding-like beta-propeller repeat protein n=1 Tax=Haloarcula TaxID=2237 RepID=UPI000F8EA3F9|nr:MULTISPECIES: PQQ-binding-like beta-propeller repeat protein [Haloarcula]NHX38535.1 PQQ-like beta-propeller repeat protein [Haloarcula sp. R1-2]
MERRALLATIGVGLSGSGCLRLTGTDDESTVTGSTSRPSETPRSDPSPTSGTTSETATETETATERTSVAELACANQKPITPSDTDDWQQPHNGSRNTGYVPGETVGRTSACVAWRREDIGPVSSSMILSDGFVIAGGSGDEGLSAFKRSTGATAWATTETLPGDDLINVRDPIIVDETVFVGAQSMRTGSHVFALNLETGAERWRTTVVNETPTIGGLRYDSGMLYGTTYTDGTTNAFAVDTDAEATAWHTELGNTGTPPVAVDDGIVYVPGDRQADYGLRALDAETGELLWGAVDQEVRGAPTVGESSVYVTTPNDVGPKTLFALDKETGETRWTFETLNGTNGSAVYADGTVTFGTSDGQLYCLTTDGTTKWRYQNDGARFSQSGPVRVGDTLIAGATLDQSGLYALDATTGDLRWTLPIPAVDMTPAVSDGVIYSSYRTGERYTYNLMAVRTD